MGAETTTGLSVRCDGCGANRGPLLKLSLGKDFFGRAYDRLSPSIDRNPKWYCNACSMHKNLQRDFRDIKAEFDKLHAGQSSELGNAEQLQRAQLRLLEITAVLAGPAAGPGFMDPAEVSALSQRIQSRAASSSTAEH